MEGFLDVSDRALDLHVEVVLRHRQDGQSVCREEVLNRLDFLRRGREGRVETVLRNPFVKIRRTFLVLLPYELGKLRFLVQGQPDSHRDDRGWLVRTQIGSLIDEARRAAG